MFAAASPQIFQFSNQIKLPRVIGWITCQEAKEKRSRGEETSSMRLLIPDVPITPFGDFIDLSYTNQSSSINPSSVKLAKIVFCFSLNTFIL